MVLSSTLMSSRWRLFDTVPSGLTTEGLQVVTVGQTAVSHQTHETYHTFTVIIPGNKLEIS